jgi:hypothetical protein
MKEKATLPTHARTQAHPSTNKHTNEAHSLDRLCACSKQKAPIGGQSTSCCVGAK